MTYHKGGLFYYLIGSADCMKSRSAAAVEALVVAAEVGRRTEKGAGWSSWRGGAGAPWEAGPEQTRLAWQKSSCLMPGYVIVT